jgi:hypothetical protein
MPPAGFEHSIPEIERLQTYVLDRAAIAIGYRLKLLEIEMYVVVCEIVLSFDVYFVRWKYFSIFVCHVRVYTYVYAYVVMLRKNVHTVIYL